MLKEPRLWWCRGQGEAVLYRWTAESPTHKREGQTGFRTLRLVHNAGADNLKGFPKSRYPAPITIELNGRRIFAKGSNWVNPELFFGRIKDETYKEQIVLAKDANMNLLRCWGGAGINKSAFYSECDKAGIMVWQEFMLACNDYSGGDDYLAVLEKEAKSIIKKLRSHPSLAIWCGGNELFNSWSGMDDQSKPLRLLNKLCYELDRDRPFLMTSPLFGMAHGGYTFIDRDTGLDVMRLFNGANNTAYTEFGVPSLASVKALKMIIPEEELFPIERTESWVLHHAFDAWGKDSWLCPDILEYYFGETDSLEETVSNSNWLQCAGYKAIFEEARRQWPHCSMAVSWCFNEPWLTAAGNSLLSYPSEPKPAYYAVKESLRDVMPSARIEKFDWNGGETFKAELWFHNDTERRVFDRMGIFLKIGEREIWLFDWDATTEPFSNVLGPTLNYKLPDIGDAYSMYLIIRSSFGYSNSYKLLYRSKENKDKKQMNI
ncbi:MAG: hypothetical protein E7623_08095 [Ruminococcaceae bacterium]|nr:hypothetical protein [Oscillospiraceae bacterium]